MTWWGWLAVGGALTVVLVVATAVTGHRNREALRRLLRFVPDCLALFRDLLRDPDVPRRAKFVTAGTVAYLALPVDLIPDFIPGLGYLDDALLVAWAIRHVIAAAGRDRVAAHWRGDPDDLDRILRLARAG